MEGEFQMAPSSMKGGSNHKRVYIGNLPNSFTSRQALQESLREWLQTQIPDLKIESIQINDTRGKSSSPNALVDCGAQANQVIRSLHQQEWQGQRLTVQREKRNNANTKKAITSQSRKPGFGKGWSAPTNSTPADTQKFSKIPLEQARTQIQSVVEEEFKHAEETGEDTVNVAIASTAAASFLAAMNALGVDNDNNFEGSKDPATEEDTSNENVDFDDDEEYEKEEPATFQIKPMAELLADFGQADPNWKTQQVDVDSQAAASNGQLAPKGKAPIHISLTSFGFSKGAPKRMDGWSYRQPLLPLDCREFPTVPPYLAWQDGLSGAVKRALQYHDRQSGEPSLQDFARKHVAEKVWQALLDAQNQGGHGYVSPLEMTIFVGSESGRHRSVVACEWAAIALRMMLRKNEGNAIQQPVSVGTFHRDVQTHRQQQYNLKSSSKSNDHGQQQGKSMKKKQMEMAGDW